MARFTKKIIRIFFIIVILLPVTAVAHYIAFPQETRCILVDYSSLENEGSLYFNPATPRHQIDTLRSLIKQASTRVANFWDQQVASPKFIYCDEEADFKKFGAPNDVPAVTHIKFGEYIVLNKSGLDIDIIAHELSHAEFYQRVGFYNWNFKIPAWFKHGLAMQNDYRNYYSEDTLRVRSNNFANMPAIKDLQTDGQFYSGTIDQVMLNYMAAKHYVKVWYTRPRLDKLITEINSGKSFEEAFANSSQKIR